MASITIRSLDDRLKEMLRLQAARHGHSMEQEAREILYKSVMSAQNEVGFAHRINQRFAVYKVEALPIPARKASRQPPKLKK